MFYNLYLNFEFLTSVIVEILSWETVLLDNVLVSSIDVNTSSTVDRTSWEPSFEPLSKLDVPKFRCGQIFKYKKNVYVLD